MNSFFGRRLNRGLHPIFEVQRSTMHIFVGFLALTTALLKRAMNVVANRLFIRFGGGALLMVCSLNSYAWYNASWNYRVPINVPAGASVNSTIEVNVDFVALLTTLGVVGTLDVNSPRVVRSDDISVSTTQEFTDTLYNSATDAVNNGRGEIRFLLQDAGAITYYLYFDIAANGPKAANPQTPINGNFEKGVAGTQNPPGWTASKANSNFDAQVRPSESPSISDADGSPSTVTTDGTPLTGGFSYLLGGRTNAESVTASPSVTLNRSIVVPATSPGNLVLSYRVEGWDSSDNGATQWDYLRIRLMGSPTTEIVGPTYGNYVTYPFSPNKGTGQIRNNSSGYGEYNQWDMDRNGNHRSGMTLAAGSQPWFTRTFALTPYAGQTITLQITTNESESYKSWVHIDDVEWSMVVATLGPPSAKSLPLHHIEIQHGTGTGLTCAASTLNIKACADAGCAPYAGGVSGTLSATGTPTVNWDGNTGGTTGSGFVMPAGGSVTKNVHVATAGTVTFGVASATPTPTNPAVCNFGTNSPTNNNCAFTASTAGFIFSDTSTPGDPYTILPQRSGITTAVNALYLRAVQASTTNPAVCTPAIVSSTTSVNMGYACNNPLTCQAASNLATINATPIAAGSPNANPTQFSTPVSLTFDANGSAPITARYDDVGQITLNASASVTPFGSATPVTLIGSSKAFVVAPHHFGFSAMTAGPIKAGTPFSATVTAYNGLGSATGNFGRETAAEGVTLTSTLVAPNPVTYPAAGNPTLGNNVIPASEFGAGGMVSDSNGVATVNNLSWDEVGTIMLKAALTNGAGYLGSELTASATSASLGPFIPDHFDTGVVATAGVPMPCPTGLTCPTLYNGFVYSGQPFSVQVTAKNLANGTTTNYHGAYGLSNDVNLSAWDALGSVTTQNPPGTGVLANATVPAAAFGSTCPKLPSGFDVGCALTSVPTYALQLATAPADIYLRAKDSVNTTVTSRRATPANSAEGGLKVVSGRLKIGNAYGSELLALPMKATVQYYDGTRWVTSTTDSLSAPGGAVTAIDVSGSALSLCEGLNFVTTPAAVTFGVGGFTLTTPTNGRCDADIKLTLPGYLPSLSGRATFGIYKSPLIYRRENY